MSIVNILRRAMVVACPSCTYASRRYEALIVANATAEHSGEHVVRRCKPRVLAFTTGLRFLFGLSLTRRPAPMVLEHGW
jgi:hypothetical protein